MKVLFVFVTLIVTISSLKNDKPIDRRPAIVGQIENVTIVYNKGKSK